MINLSDGVAVIIFTDDNEKLIKLKDWGLISKGTSNIKQFKYKGLQVESQEAPCEIIGYTKKATKLDCIDKYYESLIIDCLGKNININIEHFKSMQKKDFKVNFTEEY